MQVEGSLLDDYSNQYASAEDTGARGRFGCGGAERHCRLWQAGTGGASADAFLRGFDWHALVLSIIESVLLVALAYAIATLLHKLTRNG